MTILSTKHEVDSGLDRLKFATMREGFDRIDVINSLTDDISYFLRQL
jgi:hypothetical protein